MALAGYGVTLSVVGAEVGVPLAATGNVISTAVSVWEIGVDLLNTDWGVLLNRKGNENIGNVAKKVGFYVAGDLAAKGLNKILPGAGKKIGEEGFNLGIEILTQGTTM